MEFSKAAVGILVAACVTAGASGAFLATRGAAPAQEDAVAAPPVAGAVDQSEAVVTDTPVADVAATSSPAAVRLPASAAPRASAPRPARNPQPIADATPRASATDDAIPPAADEAPVVAPLEPPRIVDNDASRTVEPAGPIYDDLVVAADSVIGLEIESAITSERARVEDVVAARVTRDVRVGDRVAIPAGSRVNGEVTLVERGGRLKDRARLGVRFTSIVLADGTRVPIETETIYREGDAPGNESAAKIGGAAIGGAILGGILGGAKGAAIGGAVGAGGGSAAVMAGGRNAATLPAGTPVTVRLEDPATVTVER